MNDNDAQKEISDLFGIIQGIIPCDKKLTNQEKLDLIYIRETKLEENIADALEFIESFLSAKGGDEEIENWDGQTPRDLLTSIRICLRRK